MRTAEYLTLTELRTRMLDGNPKKHDVPGIARSMVRFSFTMPLGRDTATNRIIAGHGRIFGVELLKERGRAFATEFLREEGELGPEDEYQGPWPPHGIEIAPDGDWMLPVWPVTFSSEAERDAYVVADNKLTERGGWDEDKLRSWLAEFGPRRLGSIGVDLDEYNRLMSGFRVRLQGDPDIAPPLPAKAISIPGELWLLGDHRLMIGDSTDAAVLARACNDELADVCWTDPPYNVGVGDSNNPRKTNRSLQNDNLGKDFVAWLERCVDAWWNRIHVGANTYVAMSSQEWPTLDALLRVRGFHWSTTIIWAKDRFTLTRRDFHSQYEPIWYGWRGDAPRRRKCVERDVGDLWEIPRPSTSEDHPTQKPVELVVRSLRYTSHRGDLVLDPFGGSGTTMIAAEHTGRRAALVEIDPRYADVIIERWQSATGGKAQRA